MGNDRRATWLPSALVAAALLSCAGFYYREADRIRSRELGLTAARAEMFVRSIDERVSQVADHLALLSTGDGFKAFLENGSDRDLKRAVQRAVHMSQLADSYDQIRFIDPQGREVFRVERGGRVVPDEELQEKSGRDYFEKAMELERGQMYLSAFDLNNEHGAVEMPAKPVWRFAVPVFDEGGTRRGVYVLNHLGDALFEELRNMRPDLFDQLRVLNARGYWLKGSDPALEWGFMFPERSDATMAQRDPVVWKMLSGSPRGTLARDRRLLAWHRIELPAALPRGRIAVISEDPFLIVALERSGGSYDALFRGIRDLTLVMAAVLGIIAFVLGRMIVARLETARELRRSEENLSVTLNSIGDAVLATDREGRITRMNPVAEKLTGWSGKEAVGVPVADVFRIINEVTREPATIPVEQVLTTGEVQGLANHTTLIARDGSEHPIADSAAPIRSRSGVVVGVVMVFRDVAAERKARQELDRFFSLSLDFLCIASSDGTFKRVSPAVTDVLGWQVDEFLRTPYIEMVHPDDREATLMEVERQVSAGERVMHFENRYRHKDGGWRVLSWRSVPFGDLMYATARDVTEERAKQEEIGRLNEELRRQTARMELANQELEAFSYSVSHDLRAPLRHIQGYVEMLIRDAGESLAEKPRRYLKTIAAAGRDMGQLIDDLLSFSRMGRAEMREKAVDINALAEEVRDEICRTIGDRQIRWKIAKLPPVRGDAAMLKQVLANLLGNAVKYTRGRPSAEIELGGVEGDNGEIEFFVRDNGAGFDMKYADKLFGVFERLHRADEFEGTGIGLATVRRIITRHGGRTWAEGAVDEGATFHFTLVSAAAGTEETYPI